MQPDASPPTSPDAVVSFWREAGPARWFRKDETFDAEFRARFLEAHEAAAAGRLAHWEASAEGTLALLILLDQFPRNAFRGTARMFATDAQALQLARHALEQGFDVATPPDLRNFFYLPFTHSESLSDQELCVRLARALDAESLRWAEIHRDIVARFGRFPHRNALLGRETTPAEQQFLDEGGFAG
ncbi:DUF924 family protein [Ramlibacter sp. AN1015]|uniref:DUF924 family protein n=1 Tax=Ramlibacter sp. AN1015 TaxID=3133428 RepID=UPI0030BD4372